MLKLMRFLKPFAFAVATVCFLVLFQSLSQLFLPTLMANIVDKGIKYGDTAYILRIGLIMLGVSAIGAASMILSSYLSARVFSGFGRSLRKRVFTRVEAFSLQEFDTIGTASLITRTTNDINQVQQVVMMAMRMMLSAPLMLIGGVIMAVSKDARMSLILIYVLPVLAIIVFFVSRIAIPLFNAMQKKLDRLNLVLREGLSGIRVVRAFNRVEHEKKRFDVANRDLMETSLKVNRLMATMMPLMTIIFNFTTVAIVWFASRRIDTGHMEVGAMMAFIQYVMMIMGSLMMFSMMFVMIPRAAVSANRINEVLETMPIINNPADATDVGERRGYVEFRDVTFSYPGAEKPAISDISFSAGPGEVTAIIGGTGSGKSTLINLIPRFYDVDSGSILVDGVDVRELTQESLRAKIGLVPQTAVLFTGTVAENIRYGKSDASDEDVRHAATVAQAMDFVSGMKEGFDSRIARGGTNVSGGQKQRLSIARALVRRPEIYIFDDSFSALDFKTDARLRAALKEETMRSTVLIVAQRVSTVMDADRIIVLDEGRITGIGTHKDLYESCAVYREIVLSQLSEEELA